MDRRDWYYRQKVLEDELDAAFDGSENADLNIVKDLGLCRDDADPGVYGGIAGPSTSFDVSHLSGLDMYVAAGAGYRSDGKRVGTATNYTVSVSHAGAVPVGGGGIAAGALTDPGVGNKRVVSIFIAFERKLSDMRYDGYNHQVYFKRDESFYFYLTVGAPKLISDPTAPIPPSREPDKHLLTDVIVSNAAGTVTYVSHDQTRREWQFNLRATNTPYKTIIAGRVRLAVKALLEFYNDHIAGIADRHTAPAIDFTPAQLWTDGTGGHFGASSLVSTALNAIVYDIAKANAISGTQRMGARAQTAALFTPDQAHPLNLAQSSLDAQLKQIMDAVNGRVFRGGDNGIGGMLSPATDGTALGEPSWSWDAYLRHVAVKGAVRSNLIPSLSSYELGSSSTYWGKLWASAIKASVIDATTLNVLDAADIAGVLTTHEDVYHHLGEFHVTGALAQFTCSGGVDVRGPLSVIAQNPGSGFVLSHSGSISGEPGWLAQIRSRVKGGFAENWLNIDKMGGVFYGPLFTDNFQYVAQMPSATLSEHLPPHKWEGYTSGGYFSLGNASEKRALFIDSAGGVTNNRSHWIAAGGWWDIGRLLGLSCVFTMGPGYSGVPVLDPGEYIRGGFVGLFYGSQATIRLDTNGAWGYFHNGSSVAWGGVNLLGGPPVASGVYTFRIFVYSSNIVFFMGPNGIGEGLSPSSGAINAGETCKFQFSYDSFASVGHPSSGRTGCLFDVWINEQVPRTLQ